MWHVLVFQLKPYVSYKVQDMTESEFTAHDLFDATYARVITDDFKSGKLDPDKVTERIKRLKPSN